MKFTSPDKAPKSTAVKDFRGAGVKIALDAQTNVFSCNTKRTAPVPARFEDEKKAAFN
jgi:hypothetical protein